MPKLKKIVIFILILLFVIIAVLLGLKTSRTIFNKENISGNTPGNLFNGGLFSQFGDKIYFSNYKDDGALYVMDLEGNHFEKLSSDKVGHINVLGKYIYYIRNKKSKDANSKNGLDFNSNGIFRIDLKGNNIKALYDKPSTFMNVHGNYVYYRHYDKDELTFYSVKIDGSEEKKISNLPIIPISIFDNILYYSKTKNANSIIKMNLNDGSTNTLYSDENTYAPVVNGDFIYFISISDNYSIKRIHLDGSNPKTIVKDSCSTFNISPDGKYLYYQVDDTISNRICIMNLETGEVTTLLDGDYKEIHIAGNNVYFSDFNKSKTYYIPIGATNGISTFNPPVFK